MPVCLLGIEDVNFILNSVVRDCFLLRQLFGGQHTPRMVDARLGTPDIIVVVIFLNTHLRMLFRSFFGPILEAFLKLARSLAL